jgi:hypothetical protein
MCHTSVTPTKAWGTIFATQRHTSAREYIPLRLFVVPRVQGTCAGGPKSVYRIQCLVVAKAKKEEKNALRRVPIARAQLAPEVHVPNPLRHRPVRE